MYKLLIVEDEEIFRNVLPTIIDWRSIGFEVAGVCENGYKALEFLDHTEVDTILTDIRMPVVGGLELAKEVGSRYPQIKVTLYSAFNEFEYARKGLECGVYGYILKSEGEDEIVSHYAKLREVLQKEHRHNHTPDENPMKNRRIVDEALDYIRKHYSGQISLEELAKHLHVHPVHVSRLFSKEIGKTFKQVLTEVRMEEAKRLLKDIHYKVYEISSLVGYEKPRYFSELFRSVTGLTPLEYREKYKG